MLSTAARGSFGNVSPTSAQRIQCCDPEGSLLLPDAEGWPMIHPSHFHADAVSSRRPRVLGRASRGGLMSFRLSLVAVGLIGVVVGLSAQSASVAAPKPGPEHKRLEV